MGVSVDSNIFLSKKIYFVLFIEKTSDLASSTANPANVAGISIWKSPSSEGWASAKPESPIALRSLKRRRNQLDKVVNDLFVTLLLSADLLWLPR